MWWQSGWAPALITVFATIFQAGLLYGKVASHEKRLDEHGEQLDTHEGRLNDHAVKIAETKGWREGYSAAKDATQ